MGVAPPLIGVAVKVTLAPAQEGLLPVVSAMVIAGVTDEATVIVIPELVAVVGLAHVAFDVSTHVIICPFVKVAVVNVLLFVPTLVAPTFH